MSTADAMKEALSGEINAFLQGQGHTVTAAKKEFDDFYTAIEPDLIEQLSYFSQTADPVSASNLNFLRDRLILKAASIGIGIVQQERKAVVSIILAVIRVILALK